MKKFGKVLFIVGYILLAVLLTGLAFKSMHWPGANLLTLLSLSIFPYWYLSVAAVSSFKEKPFNGLIIAKSFVGGFAAMCLSVGILFRIMHWPGSAAMILAGGVLFVAFLVLFFLNLAKHKRPFDKLDKLTLMISSIILAIYLYVSLSN